MHPYIPGPRRITNSLCTWLLTATCFGMPIAACAADTPLATAVPAEFGVNCSVCHGGAGEGTDRAPALQNNRMLRGKSEAEIQTIISKGLGNMPAFPNLPETQLQSLAYFIHSLNATAFDVKPAGDLAAGAAIFFGEGRCAECHMAQGRGGINGPDLSSIARSQTLAELEESLLKPDARISSGYTTVQVRLKDGSVLTGFARARTAHSIVLQTPDGRLRPLVEDDYTGITEDPHSSMPAFTGTVQQRRDLLAFLSRLDGVPIGPAHDSMPGASQAEITQVLDPKPGEWPSYAGTPAGNRYSPLSSIDTQNVTKLRTAWIHPLPYDALETTPVVVDGIMYVTAPDQIFALDARTGTEIWSYARPRSPASEISGDAAKGANRGVAVLGDRLFFITDNAHLLCLQRISGALLWDVATSNEPGHYGGTSAPLVVGDLVITGVSGGDENIRGYVSAYRAATGELAWRFNTVPRVGEPNAKTWQGAPDPRGGSSWTTGSYDPASGVLYVAVGNPYPDTDGDRRGGDNLYTDSDLALDARTGKLLWYFQFTPHDLHDWDANQPLVLIDAPFHGKVRKLLLHANRNGFFYVLDRTNGKLLQATAFVKRLTWASGIDANGRPKLLPANETTVAGVETCPAVRGATNWYSTAYNPQTRLYYVMSVEDCTVYRKAQDGGYGRVTHPSEPPAKILRAIDVNTGNIAWEAPMLGSPERNYAGVLSTAGGLTFFGETSGGFAAVDARSGRYLWHFDSNQPWKASPMTYAIDGRQYIAIASGSNILSFSLPPTNE